MHIKSVKYREKERILSKAIIHSKPLTSQESFSGSAPTPFVGRYGYPNIRVGIMAPPHHEHVEQYDAPREWARQNLGVEPVVKYRSGMIMSTFHSNIKQLDKLIPTAQEVAMASKAPDIEVNLHKRPSLGIRTSQYHAPLGPQAELKKLAITSNTRIHKKVDYYANDEILAVEAVTDLYKRGIDENKLTRMLSTGVFGKDKKLVPTRWSITATDDILGKDLLVQVKDHAIYDYAAYFGGYMGNYYLILCFPEHWSYELFEMYVKPGPVLEYSTDHERFSGRKTYADNTAGGYYTVRLGIAEHLNSIKKQATVLALRFITDEYVLPLGVWVTREATRNALRAKPIRFGSKELMLTYAKQLAKKKFGVVIEPILKKSELLKEKQKMLTHY